MAYLSKAALLKAYAELGNLFSTKDQGLTTVVSVLRYCFALDMFNKAKSKDLDCSSKAEKDDFIKNVGSIVSINDTEYTVNFYNKIEDKRDFGVSSNFFSAGTVPKSKVAKGQVFDFPVKMPPLFQIKDYVVVRNPSLYPNISTGYLKQKELKVAFSVWLCRNHDIGSDICLGIKNCINTLFSTELANELLISDADFHSIFDPIYDNTLNPQKATLTKADIDSIVQTSTGNNNSAASALANDKSMQKIFFGTPGAGKSFKVTEIIEEDISDGNDVKVVRTVFHPDSDFSSFVGSYKPIMKQGTFYQPDGTPVPGINVEKISYEFVPQAFMQAYKLAWENPETHVYLVIEEINRGNCAQIFGELFQLLDRKDGFSEYPISANSDFQEYLSKINPDANGLARLSTIISDIEAKGIYLEGAAAGKTPKELFCKFLCLPDNLYILATMNTSDQSLFPMDSAFKRRWDMEYVEIKYEGSGKDSDNFEFVVNGQHYYWIKFLKRINELIYDATESEDKQMGNFFMKSPVISEEAFKSKVMFYLWEEVCKDLGKSSKNFYKIAVDSGIERFTFNDLYKDETRFLEGGKVINGKRVLELFLDRIDDKKEFRVTPAPAAATAVTPPTAPATGTAATTPASPATGSGN